MNYNKKYYINIVLAFIRGTLSDNKSSCYIKPIEELNIKEVEELFKFANSNKLKLQYFKRTKVLPRVKKVIGLLKGIMPKNLLDIGSGRGAFLWPFADLFKNTQVTAIDLLQHRVDIFNAVAKGGLQNIKAFKMDTRSLSFSDQTFDVTCALEVIEHIQQIENVLRELFRVTKYYLIISVPSKEDTNPEHIHLISERWLRSLFKQYNISKIEFHYVLNHMIAMVKK